MRIVSIFGLNYCDLSMDDVLGEIEKAIFLKDRPIKHFTLSAELIVMANEDPALKEIYNAADLLTIDSYVVYYASRLLGKEIPEPVSGSRVMLQFLPIAQKKGYRLYLLGAAKEVVAKVVENIKNDYPGINIVGWHDGYFGKAGEAGEAVVVADIKRCKPDVLFVAMSSPLKEKFIHNNTAAMNVPVSIGVGGIFDIIAGKCQLAPEWVSKIGLEWLYRFIQEPRRMWRRYLITNFKFMGLVIKEFLGRSKTNV